MSTTNTTTDESKKLAIGQAKLEKLAEDAVEAYKKDIQFMGRMIPCYMVSFPLGAGEAFSPPVCSKRALEPEESKAWLKANLRRASTSGTETHEHTVQVGFQEDWGRVMTWLKVNVLPNPRDIVYED